MTILGLTDFLKNLRPQGRFAWVVQFEIKFPRGSVVYGDWPKQRRLSQAEGGPPDTESQSFMLLDMQS